MFPSGHPNFLWQHILKFYKWIPNFVNKKNYEKESVNSFLGIFGLFVIICVRIRIFSRLYFPVLGLNTERYSLSLRLQSECKKMRTRITRNTDTFYAVVIRNYALVI